MSKYRTCLVCGKSYEYCNVCDEYLHEPRWKFLFHDQNCHDIFEVLNSYGAKQITKAEAKKRLGQLDLSKLGTFADSYKKQIEDIMAEPTKKADEPKAEAAKPAKKTRHYRKMRGYKTSDSDQDSKINGDTI